MKIDTITILLALCILCSGFSVAMLLIWRLLLPMRSLLIWGCGMGCYALGVLLIALRDKISDILSLPMGNLLLLLCYCCIWAGISIYRDKRPWYRTMLLFLVLFVPVYSWYTWPDPDIAIRTALVRVFMMFFLSGSLFTLLRNRTACLSLMEKVVTGALLLDVCFRGTLVAIQLANMSYTLPLSKNMVTAASSVMSIIGMTTWGLAVVMLTLEQVSSGLTASNQKLSESLELFDLFMFHSPIYTFIKEVSGKESRVLQASENFVDMVGLSGSQMRGKNMHELFSEPFASRLTADDQMVVNEGIVLHQEEQLNNRSYITYKFPIQRGEKRLLAGYTIDITKLRQSEQSMREIQAQLLQQDKLASIGQLSAGIAHEINNPMGFINSNLGTLGKYVEKFDQYISAIEQLLQQTADPQQQQEIINLRKSLKLDYVLRDVRQLVRESSEGAERVMKIVQDLKTFARSDAERNSKADLNQCLDSTLTIIWNQLKYVADLVKEYGELPAVICNIQQINQVFLNLLVNAAHAIEEKGLEKTGIVTIKTWADSNNVYVAISDTGCGIPEEIRCRIFDPFFTTKEVGKGTGLGLSISHEIIKKHGGSIVVESAEAVGTTFTVQLPITPPPPRNAGTIEG